MRMVICDVGEGDVCRFVVKKIVNTVDMRMCQKHQERIWHEPLRMAFDVVVLFRVSQFDKEA